jgi:predicted nucleic acid-binding protein
MKYVWDLSVAFKWLIPERNSDKALRLRDAYRNGAVELVSPDVFPIKVVHFLTRAERQNRVTSTQGVLLFHVLLANFPTLHGSLTILPRRTKSHLKPGLEFTIASM